MNTLTTRALVALLSVLILVTVGSQIYYRLNDRHKTEEAVLCDINENIPFKGVVIRNEKVLTSSQNGVYEYLYNNGSKVAAGSTIATVYPDEQTLINKRKADSYRERADAIEKAQNPGNAQFAQPEALSAKIDAEYRKLINASINNDRKAYETSADEMFLQMNIYNVITDQSVSYTKKIAELREKADKLSAKETSVSTVEAAEAGYFVSYCDGYESKLTPDNINDLTQSDVEAVVSGEGSKSSPANAVGKMFDDYSCKIIAVLPNDKRIIEGDTVRLILSSSDSIYKVVVESVKEADDEDKSIVIMSCNRLDTEIAASRVLSFELIFDNYKGIKVPRDAIRFKDDQKGVYVILGNDVTFKKIEVIYEGTDFVVSKNTSDASYLLLYDQILLEAVSNQNESSSSNSS